jgi:hypothetical protein
MARVVPSQIVALINKHFPIIKSATLDVDHGSVAVLTAIARLVDEIPTELLIISGDDYSDLVCGVESIKNSVAFWQHKGVGAIGNSGIKGINTLSVIRDALTKCPDQIPSPRTAELVFVTDSALRESIRLDMSTATSSLHFGEWKGATVLAGAATEALLLWAIQESESKKSGATQVAISTLMTSGKLKNKPDGNAERWNFFELIEIASNLGLTKPDTAIQARLGKDFRNLIHPGRAARLGLACDRGTALAALATVELVARDLSQFFPV